jgi:hypothetical protein
MIVTIVASPNGGTSLQRLSKVFCPILSALPEDHKRELRIGLARHYGLADLARKFAEQKIS